MELRHLRYFVAVAEERNFTRAAGRLGIGQPPLSQQIRDLEREVGMALFHRVPHGAELTKAGEAFLPEARAALTAAERAKAAAIRAERGEVGRLALGFTGSASFNPLVSEAIRAFRTGWPDVELHLEEMHSDSLLEKLGRLELDAAFIRPGPESAWPDITLHALPDEAMLMALPVHHPLAAEQTSLPLAALAQERFVLFPRGVGLSLYDEIVRVCGQAGFEPLVGQEAPQMSSVVNLVAAGLGVSIVTASIAQIRLPGVVYRPFAGGAPIARLALATPRALRSPVLDNLRTCVKALLL
ncbi:LysR family transcriptional regulator [Insolitispirillum peregrinum]|uniref:Transcriptional regulator, LysR family n=1 Tax=Insolitispirillum peregrinum TaxID=80876 RepID=A0A1N7IQC9_9PROT|nr:LysR family transcriptional regulator [Insolitispirillum peregrinum]SIS39267.1 transcriptional regulator, LysR family [Insolitispirillum peregrinum]